MKNDRKFLFDLPKKEERKIADHTTQRIKGLQGFVLNFYETFNRLKTNFRRGIGNQADFYKKRKKDLVVMKKSRIEYFSKTFNVHKIRKQKMLEVFYELSEAIDLLDKDSSREHHDVIVEKGDQGII